MALFVTPSKLKGDWGFATPSDAQCLYANDELLCWINNLYHDKRFKTREEFNKAYDEWRADPTPEKKAVIHREKKNVRIKASDLKTLARAIRDEEFETEIAEALKTSFLPSATEALGKGQCLFCN